MTLAKIDSDAEYTFGAPNLTGSPERNLLVAILERAILDYVGNNEREVFEAETWLFSNSDDRDDGEFSFDWICQELDLDPVKIARIILAMPKRGSRRVAPWYFNDHEEFLRRAS